MSTLQSKSLSGPTRSRRMRAASKRKSKKVSQTYWALEQEDFGLTSDLPLQHRTNLLQQYGDFSLAFSTAMQPRLKHFGDDRGYFAYRQRWGFTFILGDGVAAPSRQAEMIQNLIDEGRWLAFCQVGRKTAELLAGHGYYVNEMGVDTIIDLPTYDFRGKEKEWLRYAANWTNRRSFEIREASFEQVSPDAVEEVSEAWRKTRTVKYKEVRFLNRPIVLRDETDVRKFFLFSPDKKLLAFVILDPLYRNGQVFGYVTAFKRRHPDAPQYAEQAIMKYVIEKLKAEGVSELRLGLSPLAWVEDTDPQFKPSRPTTRWFQYSYQAKWINRYFYHLIGHAEYKRRFRGREEKVYWASPTWFNTPRFMSLIGLCGVA